MKWPAVLVAVMACSGGSTSKPPKVTTKLLTNQLDVLFVVDNSVNGPVAQELLDANFGNFVNALDAFPRGRPDLHIGVVTTTVGTGVASVGNCPQAAPDDDGLMVNTARVMTGCAGPSGQFIADLGNSDGTRTTNYAPSTLQQVFGCIADVGSTGCGIEQPLEAMKRALDGTRPENAGFLRPDANLAVVFLADEDDVSVADPSAWSLSDLDQLQWLFTYTCDQPMSTTAPGTYTNCHERDNSFLAPTASYVDFLTSLVDPGQLIVATVGGDPATTTVQTANAPALGLAPSCTATINGNAHPYWPGIRLATFASAFGDHAVSGTSCASDYSPALTNIAARIQQVMGPCLDRAIDPSDRDAANAGVQPACTTTQGGRMVPACAMLDATTPDPANPGPCVWYAPDASCSGGAGLAVHVLGGTGAPVRVTCPLAPG